MTAFSPSPGQLIRSHFLRVGLVAFLAASTVAAWTPPTQARAPRPAARRVARKPASHSAVSRPASSRPVTPRPVLSLAQRCHFATATPDEMSQIYNELRRQGWNDAFLATVPTRYAIRDNEVVAVDPRFATFLGDVDGDGKPERVVGCHFESATPSPTPDSASPTPPGAAGPATRGPQDDRARIVVFKKDEEGHWRFWWRSPGLGNAFALPKSNLDEVQKGLDLLQNLNLPLALVDVNRDGRLEIAYYCVSQFEVIGALPGVLRLVGTQSTEQRWVNVAPHADRFSVRDVDQDGTLEVVAGSRYVGHGTGDDDVPRVWRWSGTQFQEASRSFPRFYASLASTYRAYVLRMRAGRELFDHVAWQRAIDKASSLAG